MALKISLRPNERMIIGRAVVTNGNTTATLIIENKVPVLRQKDILSQNDADSPARQIYFTIQLMYVDEGNIVTHHHAYWKLVQDFVGAAPSALHLIDKISEHILGERYYHALKLGKKLIDYEQEVLDRVCESS
ncbi:MAG: flagellar biosynthesis repressor FlbT [Thermodesulfobacteriota bacterium]|nr:flagellar biosynthesis repressor FlbT [Thermodesulfobacteriota bacterium]